jgi:hypothetical protein
MISSDIAQLITRLEERYPVDEWTVDGIRMWPLVRVKLYGYLYAYAVEAGKRAAPHSSRLARFAPEILKGALRYGHARLFDGRSDLSRPHSADAAFLSDGVSYSKVGNHWYDRFCDPLIQTLHDRGKRCFMMSRQREFYVPRHRPSMFVQPAVDAAVARALITARLRSKAGKPIPGAHEFAAELSVSAPDVPIGRVLNLTEDAVRLRAVAEYYKSLLSKVKPRIAFIVSYYSIDGMAFNLACSELGIPSIDIQHGVEGELHPAYGQWWKVPPDGYSLLPSIFWCWSDSEAAVIRRWSDRSNGSHGTVVGGNPWLTVWQAGKDAFIAAHLERVRLMKERDSFKREVLVTLQYGLSDASVLKPLLRAMRAAPPDWRWWIRLHPVMLAERERIRDVFSVLGRPVELDSATDMPLYALLPYMDSHVTHSSSVVLEAEAYGVPSIIFSHYGMELFPDQIHRGMAVAAYTPERIVETLLAAEQPPVKAPLSNAIGADTVEAALDYIFAWPPPRDSVLGLTTQAAKQA